MFQFCVQYGGKSLGCGLFDVLYSLFFIRYYFFWFSCVDHYKFQFWVLTCSRSPASITTCFSSVLNSEDNHSGVYCLMPARPLTGSLFLVLYLPDANAVGRQVRYYFFRFWHVVKLLRRSQQVSNWKMITIVETQCIASLQIRSFFS